VTVLDDILDGSTDPSVPAPDLLRKVQIAATRLGATQIVAWAKKELAGYADDDDLPSYRIVDSPVSGLFTGPLHSRITQPLTARPEGWDDAWKACLRQPLIELQALAEGESDAQVPWIAALVNLYDQSGVYRIEMHNLFSAWKVLTRQSLRGVVDVVRSRAMEFALELQADYPDAGEIGGPTVAATPGLATTVYNITNNITGHGTNLAAGPGAQQTSTLNAGDASSLLARLTELGLTEPERDEFVIAITEDNSIDGPHTGGFLARVRSGAVRLAEGFTTDVAAELLIAAGRAYLGIHG